MCREEEEKEGCCFALRIIRLNEKPRGEGLEKKFEVSRFLPPWEQWAPDSCPTATCFFCCKRCLPRLKPSLSQAERERARAEILYLSPPDSKKVCTGENGRKEGGISRSKTVAPLNHFTAHPRKRAFYIPPPLICKDCVRASAIFFP